MVEEAGQEGGRDKPGGSVVEQFPGWCGGDRGSATNWKKDPSRQHQGEPRGDRAVPPCSWNDPLPDEGDERPIRGADRTPPPNPARATGSRGASWTAPPRRTRTARLPSGGFRSSPAGGPARIRAPDRGPRSAAGAVEGPERRVPNEAGARLEGERSIRHDGKSLLHRGGSPDFAFLLSCTGRPSSCPEDPRWDPRPGRTTSPWAGCRDPPPRRSREVPPP
jgi:hypothetical protein